MAVHVFPQLRRIYKIKSASLAVKLAILFVLDFVRLQLPLSLEPSPTFGAGDVLLSVSLDVPLYGNVIRSDFVANFAFESVRTLVSQDVIQQIPFQRVTIFAKHASELMHPVDDSFVFGYAVFYAEAGAAKVASEYFPGFVRSGGGWNFFRI